MTIEYTHTDRVIFTGSEDDIFTTSNLVCSDTIFCEMWKRYQIDGKPPSTSQ